MTTPHPCRVECNFPVYFYFFGILSVLSVAVHQDLPSHDRPVGVHVVGVVLVVAFLLGGVFLGHRRVGGPSATPVPRAEDQGHHGRHHFRRRSSRLQRAVRER